MSERDKIVNSNSANFTLDRVVDDIYDESGIMCSFYEVIGRLIDEFDEYSKDVTKQGILSKATWGLTLWSDEYGIPISPGMDYQTIRNLINERRQYVMPPNETQLAKYLEGQLGRECEITQWVGPYKFLVEFYGNGPLSYRRAYRLTKAARQAHLCFDIVPASKSGYVIESDKTIFKFKNTVAQQNGLRAGLYPSPVSFGRYLEEKIEVVPAGSSHQYENVFTLATKAKIKEADLSFKTDSLNKEYDSRFTLNGKGVIKDSEFNINSDTYSRGYKTRPTGVKGKDE